MPGSLYIVATPIGNLEDITLRALRILREVSLIACEDTRQTLKLLNHYGIKKTLASYHEHNERQRAKELIEKLKQDQDIALVSDAGTPGISDPGFQIIAQAIHEDIPVIPIPGPSSVLTALVISGLPTHRFTFEGFLPAKLIARRKLLFSLKGEERTMIFFESATRLQSALLDMLDIFQDRAIALSHELTKKFEWIKRGNLSEIVKKLEAVPLKGEFVLAVSGSVSREDFSNLSIEEHIHQVIEMTNVPHKEAIKIVAQLRGIPKREAYRASLSKRLR